MTIKPQGDMIGRQAEEEERIPSTFLTDTTNDIISADMDHADATRESMARAQAQSKRQLENPLDPNKKVKTFLELRNGRTVNQFSQTCVLPRNTRIPTPDTHYTTHNGSTPSIQQSESQIKHPMLNNTEMTTTRRVERSLSSPMTTSPFLSRLGDNASEDTEDNTAVTTRDSTILEPSLFLRSRTFASITSPKHTASEFPFSKSPQPRVSGSALPSVTRPSPSTSSAASKRSDRTQSPTPSVRPIAKPRSKSTLLQRTAALSAEAPVSMTQSAERYLSKVSQGSNDEPNREHINRTTTPELESCTSAMRTLSPPSVMTRSFSTTSLIAVAQSRRSSATTGSISFSQEPFATPRLCSSDSGNDEHSQKNGSCSRSESLPPRSKVSGSLAATSPTPRRMILRRHQTMISRPSEFMRSFEFSSKRGSVDFRSSIDRKSIVFALDNYVPNLSRKECQILPHADFAPKPDDTTKRISPQTVVDVLDGNYKSHYDLLYIIDCRFPYEFEGGHIRSAVNINTIDKLEELLLQPAITDKRVLLIFHCEFSCERGPRMARHLRNQDRTANAVHYPAVFYPEVYVMQGGYSGFFRENRSYCSPEAYVKMQDEKHSQEFEQHMRVFGREFSRTASKGFLGMDSMKTDSKNNEGSVAPLHPQESTKTSMSAASTSPQSEGDVESTVASTAASIATDPNSNATTKNSVTATSGNDDSEPTESKSDNKGFATVISSVKEAVMSGAAPSTLSISKSATHSLPTASKTMNFRHVQQRSRVMVTYSQPIAARNEEYISSSNSYSNSNPFFSGFRQTKPGFRGVPP
ncbi:cell division cycle- protein [Mortierella sp. NVP85]|nr:cell division cycle- protein [Mortierella sp. NVP85]